MLKEPLTIQQQHQILNGLYGFKFENVSLNEKEHWVLYDDEGEEFYGINENSQFDFSTLAGIFLYVEYRSKKAGYKNCQFEMRKVLGL